MQSGLTSFTHSRRNNLMISFTFQGFWMYLLAGIGEKKTKTSNEKNLVVASFMLYAFFYNVSLSAIIIT